MESTPQGEATAATPDPSAMQLEIPPAGRSERFTTWVAFLVFTVITLASAAQVKNDEEDPGSAAKYAVACAAVSFVVILGVVVSHLVPMASVLLVGTKVEGIICIVLVAFWAAIVSIVTNASNGLGVQESSTNEILNGNLYYFSWAGFVTSVILLVNYLRSAFGVDLVGEVRSRGARLSVWGGMLASALVVMGSSVRILNDDCGNDISRVVDDTFCSRTKLGVALGSLGVVFSAVIVGMTVFMASLLPAVAEFGLSLLLAVMNAFGVFFITSAKGPGSAIGNLYYFSWISFLVSAYLASECFTEFMGGGSGPTSSSTDANKESTGQTEMGVIEEQI